MIKRIVICATERSGSTLLCEDMRATRRLGRPHEYFIPILEKTAPADFSKTLADTEARFAARDRGVFSVKVMMSYLPDIEAGFAASGWPGGHGSGIPYPRFLDRFREAHWIWIRRRDTASQAVSREMARQTGVTHAIQDTSKPFFVRRGLIRHDDTYNRQAQVDLDRVIAEIDRIEAENLSWQAFFDEAGIAPFVIEYEDILEPRRETLHSIAEYCEVELGKWKMDRRLVKLSNARSREIRDAVRKRLDATGTPTGD